MTKLLQRPACEPELHSARVPLTREWRWIEEWIALVGSRVYAGDGVPHGNGEPVIVVPGFLGAVSQLHPLTSWLRRIGYAVQGPGFERTAECPDVLLDRLDRQVARVTAATAARVTIIGHSLGGSLARAAAVRRPSSVAHVITLASPLRTVSAHLAVVEAARLLARLTPSRHAAHEGHDHGATCACELADALAAPFPNGVGRTAVYSRNDGVVDWRSCAEGDHGIDVEVSGTHLGLVVNVAVYESIARTLAAIGTASHARASSAGHGRGAEFNEGG